jgi:hypothetical protein
MRENGGGMPRDPNDVLCGREIDHHFLRQLNDVITGMLMHANAHMPIHQHNLLSSQCKEVFGFISSVPHLRFHDAPRFQVDRTEINLNSRKAFVSNVMPLNRFKQAIRRNHLLALKNENIAQILQAVIQAATDIAFRLLHLLNYNNIPSIIQSIPSFATEFQNLVLFANNELQIIHYDFLSPPSQRSFFRSNSFHLHNFLSNPTL